MSRVCGSGDDEPPDDGAADAEKPGVSKKHSKHKSKGKVWEKVAWFTRRSKSRDVSSDVTQSVTQSVCCEIEEKQADKDTLHDEATGYSPQDLHSIKYPSWMGSDSSSEGEFYENEDGCIVKRSKLYPNSEIVEQNCLKPSIAKALFYQMELNNYKSGKVMKYSWQKKKKQLHNVPNLNEIYGADGDLLLRAMSLPVNIVEKSKCHCQACCSCTPGQILRGLCPAHRRLSTSTSSLDTGLGNIDVVECELDQITAEEVFLDRSFVSNTSHSYQSNKRPHQAEQSQWGVGQHNYYSQSLQRKCKVCGCVIRQSNMPLNDDSQLPSLPTNDSFCQCKSALSKGQENSLLFGPCVSSRSQKILYKDPSGKSNERDTVSPLEFKSKSDTMKEWFTQFDHEQKNLLLKTLLRECELPQIHMLSVEVGSQMHHGCPHNCQDRLSWLPQSLALYILSFLDPVSLCQASSVCDNWSQLSNDHSLWRHFCQLSKWRLSTAGEQKQLINHMMPNGSIHWKRVFAERYRLRNNWLRGRCNVRTFEGHTQGISCVQFDDTRIVSGSHDKTIKVWNIRTNSPWSVQTLVGHSGTVRCLHLEGNRLVSGSTDKSIKVWDLSTQQSWSSIACKVTMLGHMDTVRCLQVDDKKVISGSYDKTLKVWDISTGLCRMTLRGHDAAVLCVQFDDDKIISGSCDKTIKVWTFTSQCVMTLHGHHDAVTCLQFDEYRIISGSLDCNLKFWDVRSGQCKNTIDWKASEGHTGVVRCLQADSWRVVSASDDRTLKVWNLETGQRLVTLRNHTDGVTCLQFNDSIIVSGSYDKTVKLWDFGCC